MTETQLREIFDKTRGHCHFCGDQLSFSKRGQALKKQPAGIGHKKGFWEVDHVARRSQLSPRDSKGNRGGVANCLPACTGCNRLRWHRKGGHLRRSIQLGLIARREIQKKTEAGREIERLFDAWKTSTWIRRETDRLIRALPQHEA